LPSCRRCRSPLPSQTKSARAECERKSKTETVFSARSGEAPGIARKKWGQVVLIRSGCRYPGGTHGPCGRSKGDGPHAEPPSEAGDLWTLHLIRLRSRENLRWAPAGPCELAVEKFFADDSRGQGRNDEFRIRECRMKCGGRNGCLTFGIRRLFRLLKQGN
jgi:hypothetical protein